MCGIVGYSGAKDAVCVLLGGLGALEYRGYDSAGVSVFSESSLKTVKSAGRLAVLSERLASHPLPGSCGIGHTRWATHGVPSDVNAHPHGTKRGHHHDGGYLSCPAAHYGDLSSKRR